MARINIAEIDIDFSALEKKAQDAKQSIYEISKEISQLKKEQAEAEKQIQEYTSRLSELRKEGKENSKEAETLRKKIAESKEVIYQNNGALAMNETIIKKLQSEYRTYNTILTAHVESGLKNNKAIEVTNGSIKQLSSALSHNKQLYQELSEEERNKAEIGGKLLKVIQEQDAKYKELQKSIGNTQVEVGNYKEEIKKALTEHYGFGATLERFAGYFGIFGKAAVSAGHSLKAWVLTTKTADGVIKNTTTSVRLFRGALLGTGIGAIVFLLGSFISYLTSTQEGINKLNRVLIPLKEVFASLLGVLQNVGKALFETFSNPKQALKDFGQLIQDQIINRLTAVVEIGKGVMKIFTGEAKEGFKQMANGALQSVTGVKNVIDKVDNFGKSVKNTFDEAWKRGQKIADIERELQELNITYKNQMEDLKLQFKQQNNIVEDTNASLKEREAAAVKGLEIQKQINALATERNQKEIELLELKTQANDTSDADKEEIQKKIAELKQQQQAQVEAETTMRNKLNQVRKEANEKAKAQLQQNLEEEKKLIADYLASGSGVAKSLEERLKLEEKAKNDRLNILEKEKKAGLVTTSEYNRQKNEIELEFLGKRAELTASALGKEIDLYEALNQSKIDKEKQLTSDVVKAEKTRLENIYQMKVDALEKEKQLKIEAGQWDYDNEKQLQIQLLDLKKSQSEEIAELDKSLKNAQDEERKTLQKAEFEARILEIKGGMFAEFEIQKEKENQKFQIAKDALDKQLAEGKISVQAYHAQLQNLEKDHTKAIEKIDKAKTEAQVALASSMFGQLKGLAGEHTAVGKASAIAEASMNTYLAANKALASVENPILGGIMAALVVAMGLQNVAKIMAVPTPSANKGTTKYAGGGLVKGRSHAEGGVPFSVAGEGGYEMEGGEYIVNKKATSLFFPHLEALNKIGQNGNSFPAGFYAGGGLVQRSIINNAPKDLQIDMEAMKEAIREGAKAGASEGASVGTFAGALQGTQIGATQGIRDREVDTYIENQSSF